MGYNIIKKNIADNNIVGNNIFLKHGEAILKIWGKLVFIHLIFCFRRNIRPSIHWDNKFMFSFNKESCPIT